MRGAKRGVIDAGLSALLVLGGCLGANQDGAGTGGEDGSGGTTGGSAVTGGNDGSGGATGGNAVTGGSDGSGGNAGTGGAIGQVCDGIQDAFASELAAVQACTQDTDCGQVLSGTSCGCTRNLVARLDADVSELERLMAVEVNGERCVQLVSTCDCPQADGFACEQGVCTWNYLDPVSDCCSAQEVSWGPNGGLVAPGSQPLFTVSDCAFYRDLGGESCSSALSCGNPLSGSNLTEALADTDVQAAIAAAPVLFGVDTRVVDGPILRITVATAKGPAQIEVGSPCSGSTTCEPIPDGVAALAKLLRELSTQQTEGDLCVTQNDNPACNLPAAVGDCDAAIQRYYFNAKTRQCETFTWGGCGGNDNNFTTLSDCQAACPETPLPTCEQPVQPGPCRGAFPRFYFNATSGTCDAFTYGGCGGNDNNFDTVDACNAACTASMK